MPQICGNLRVQQGAIGIDAPAVIISPLPRIKDPLPQALSLAAD